MLRSKLLVLVLLCASWGCGSPNNRVVLYCAQDREFANEVLPLFTKEHGITLAPKFDTEADKSVSLYVELVAEQKKPRCDVFWNNEILSTIRLRRQGLLEAYESPASAPFPADTKATDHTWQAFAARARVLLVNTDKVKELSEIQSIFTLTDKKWANQIALGRPQFGTTATHAACLFEVLGEEGAEQFFRALRANGVQIAAGNKQVAEWVSSGRVAVGLTDTDDALIEIEQKKPVVIVFPDAKGHPDHARLGTLYLPNTLAIIKGSPNPAGAKKLLDFLLSPRVEAKLAESASRQIPLNPQVQAKLHPQIRTPSQVRTMAVDFEKAADLWEKTQTFLREQFARP